MKERSQEARIWDGAIEAGQRAMAEAYDAAEADLRLEARDHTRRRRWCRECKCAPCACDRPPPGWAEP